MLLLAVDSDHSTYKEGLLQVQRSMFAALARATTVVLALAADDIISIGKLSGNFPRPAPPPHEADLGRKVNSMGSKGRA